MRFRNPCFVFVFYIFQLGLCAVSSLLELARESCQVRRSINIFFKPKVFSGYFISFILIFLRHQWFGLNHIES